LGLSEKGAAMDVLEAVMKWVVAPVAAFVWILHSKQQTHSTDIEVLKAQASATNKAHDLEMKNLQILIQKVFDKLDNIEASLRK
jgi:ABC-type iron transport system FetAB ATPase subunit